MARTDAVDFEMVYKLTFESVIRGHHVYKATWNPEVGEQLECQKDTRKEAKDYDEHTVGIFKISSREGKKTIVGHAPIELSSLTDYFLKADESNSVLTEVTGKRKREVGLVVSAKFTGYTVNRRHAQVLDSELSKKEEKFIHLQLLYEPNCKRYPTLKL